MGGCDRPSRLAEPALRKGDGMNPLIPNVVDVLWGTTALAATVVALISVIRTRAALGAAATWIWALAIVLVPILGAVAWLASSGRLRHAEAGRRRLIANRNAQ
jgi:hypothetical protein